MSRLLDEEHVDNFMRPKKVKQPESVILPRVPDEPRLHQKLPENYDDDMGKSFRMRRKDQKKRRAARRPKGQEEIIALVKAGFHVETLTLYQFRINDRLDLFPVHKRWHDVERNKRGSYKTALGICNSILRR